MWQCNLVAQTKRCISATLAFWLSASINWVHSIQVQLMGFNTSRSFDIASEGMFPRYGPDLFFFCFFFFSFFLFGFFFSSWIWKNNNSNRIDKSLGWLQQVAYDYSWVDCIHSNPFQWLIPCQDLERSWNWINQWRHPQHPQQGHRDGLPDANVKANRHLPLL